MKVMLNIRYSLALLILSALTILSVPQVSFSFDQEQKESLSELLLHKTFTDSEVKAFAYLEGSNFIPGQLVLMRKATSAWVFGILKKCLKNDTYEVSGIDQSKLYQAVKIDALKAVLPFWQYLFQPTQNLNTFEQVVDERLAYYKKNGAPDGHGMIVPAGSMVIFFGDFNGSYSSLQNYMLQLHKDGLLDNNNKLKPNCYLVALGNYVGCGPHGVEILNSLLNLQKANPDRVYLLAGDHESLMLGDDHGFKKEFFEKFSKQAQEDNVKKAWQKLANLCTSLPRILLLGLQMPSTHNYDFLLFCHGCFAHTWRPQDFMQRIIKKHLNDNYESEESLPYVTKSENKEIFLDGQFICEKSHTAPTKSCCTKNAFEDFVAHHGSHVDHKYMYQFCLKALLRGHNQNAYGLARLKDTSLKLWKHLKNNKTYAIEQGSVFSCISGSQGLPKSDSYDNAFGIIQAGLNGQWYITARIESI